MEEFVPTRLYIKQHKITKMKYLGKSVVENIDQYKGSGVYWQKHINKYGKEHVITLWVSDWYYDSESIQKDALQISIENDIVDSIDENGNKIWANLILENGLDGGPPPSPESKQKHLETVSSPEWKSKQTQANINRSNTIKLIRSSNEWKRKNYILCEYCKGTYDKGNYNQYHGDKCKLNPNSSLCHGDRYKRASQTQKETKNNQDWKKKNSLTCEHCGKTMLQSRYSLYHGDRCKMNPNRIEFVDEGAKKCSHTMKTEEYKLKHRKICEHCGKILLVSHYFQHHGNRCKMNPNKINLKN